MSRVLVLSEQELLRSCYDPRMEVSCPVWGIVKCRRDNNAWTMWMTGICGPGGPPPADVDETRGIVSGAQFVSAFLRCGVDYGVNPDLEDLEPVLPQIAAEDPRLGAELTAQLDSNTKDPQNKPEPHPIPYPLKVGTFAILRANGVIVHIERSPTGDDIRQVLGQEWKSIDIQGGHELLTATTAASRNSKPNRAASTLAAFLAGVRGGIYGDTVLVRDVHQRKSDDRPTQ